jgi:catechol 2,3-dioxygenase-like lactoylglutathione lyase family enzyme
MAFLLDHVVVAVADLDRAVTHFRSLGFTVRPGGVHHGGVSHNALIVFADRSYVEIIAFRQDAPANRWWQLLKSAGEGIVDFALLPDDIENDLAAVRARGLDMEGPIAGGRIRPDGVAVDWQIARPKTTDLPFWCYDVTPRALRVPSAEVDEHPNGATGISEVRIATSNLPASCRRYHALVGGNGIDRTAEIVTTRIGTTGIEHLDGDHADIRSHLAARGEGVFSVALSGLKRPLDGDRPGSTSAFVEG